MRFCLPCAENVPTDYVRPTGDSQDFVVEKWIRDKYERKLFCPADTEPPTIHAQVHLVNLQRCCHLNVGSLVGNLHFACFHTYPSSRKALQPLDVVSVWGHVLA